MSAGWLIAAGAALAVLLWGAGRFTFWRRDIPGVPILMYHYLSDRTEGTELPKLRVRPEAFAGQVEYLHRHGYQTIGFRELHQAYAKGRPLPERPVIITFDDGARECLTIARDILKTRDYMAVVFPVSARVGRVNVWDRVKKRTGNKPYVLAGDCRIGQGRLGGGVPYQEPTPI